MGFIFIGDSMPTKPASSFLSPFAHSLLAFHPEQVYCGRKVSSHCQFKLLIVQDVDRLLSQPESVWNALEAEYVNLTRCHGCCVWVPDEYVIGEVLLQCGTDEATGYQGIMEYDLVCDNKRPCGRPVNHAATFKFGSRRYDLAMKHAQLDEFTFAIRKVK